MANTGSGRYNAEVIKGFLAPAQEFVAFAVALHFDIDVFLERRRMTELIDHHRVVDHQVHWRERVDTGGILAQFFHRRAHGGEVDHARHTGKVLHQYPRWPVAYFTAGFTLFLPIYQGLHVFLVDAFVVSEA